MSDKPRSYTDPAQSWEVWILIWAMCLVLPVMLTNACEQTKERTARRLAGEVPCAQQR